MQVHAEPGHRATFSLESLNNQPGHPVRTVSFNLHNARSEATVEERYVNNYVQTARSCSAVHLCSTVCCV